MGKLFKLTFEKKNDQGIWMPGCMNCFGHGYSVREADTLKMHLESKSEYRNVKVEAIEI